MSEFLGALLFFGVGSVAVLGVLGWALTRPDNRQFHQEYRAAKRGYYPDKQTITTDDANRLQLGTCPGGCSTGPGQARILSDDESLEEYQANQKQDLIGRFSKQANDIKHVPPPVCQPGPQGFPVHPRGTPIPAPEIFYKDQQTQRRE